MDFLQEGYAELRNPKGYQRYIEVPECFEDIRECMKCWPCFSNSRPKKSVKQKHGQLGKEC